MLDPKYHKYHIFKDMVWVWVSILVWHLATLNQVSNAHKNTNNIATRVHKDAFPRQEESCLIEAKNLEFVELEFWIINCKAADLKSMQAEWDNGVLGFSTWAKAGLSIDLHLFPRVSMAGIETRYRAIQVRSGYRPIHILGVVWYFIPYSYQCSIPGKWCYTGPTLVYTPSYFLHFIRVKHTKVIRACEQSINSYHKLTHG